MSGISRRRSKQTATATGLGVHDSSPLKARNPKRKTQAQTTTHINHAFKKKKLEAQLARLLNPPQARIQVESDWQDINEDNEDRALPTEDTKTSDDMDVQVEPSCDEHNDKFSVKKAKPRRLTPDQATINLYEAWKSLLPTLVNDLFAYNSRSIGKVVQPANNRLSFCASPVTCIPKVTQVMCLYYDHFKTISIHSCKCRTTSQSLVNNGLFPTSPTLIRVAVSIDLLNFYSALFERSCDAVNAMAAAMNMFYRRRGYHLLDYKGESYREPFRRGLGHAAQWLDGLQTLAETKLDAALQRADSFAQGQMQVNLDLQDSTSHVDLGMSSGKCARILQQLCPACFGGTQFGRPFEEGGDIHVCTDGNFHHKHLVSGGQSIPFHHPKHIIPKEFVDEVGDTITNARKAPPNLRRSKVPDDAVDECESSYEAANGDKKTAASTSRYDDQGWMSLICRHDIPLFFANIDTPGEQQKYAVALILWLFQHLPPAAKVVILYDVGCVLDRSLELEYNILPQSVRNQVNFSTTAMHTYGHQWACQIFYGPRFRKGMGLTDGEGVERIWSRLRKLIAITRAASRARRLWLTDRQLRSIAHEMRDELGDWISRRLRRGVIEQGKKANTTLQVCDVPIDKLRHQWELQRAAQLSVRAHAPARLKKELDTVLTLQGDLEVVEKAIQATKIVISKASAPSESTQLLKKLHETHGELTDQVEVLYASLNIHESYPQLTGVSLDFVRTLLMARDLKINIRKRAIGSFFEWDRLDQAVGGRHQPLGTKLHQQTRKAIAKRKPALMKAIKKFNSYCERLEKLYNPASHIPLPLPLPLTLADLRDNSSLMEDVWITPSVDKPPAWLEDSDVRVGIRAMHKADRCLEERRRLGRESDNLCRWFGRELAALELVLRMPEYEHMAVEVLQRRERLLQLKPRWVNPMVSALRFDSHIRSARLLAIFLTGGRPPVEVRWITSSISPADEDATDMDMDNTQAKPPQHSAAVQTTFLQPIELQTFPELPVLPMQPDAEDVIEITDDLNVSTNLDDADEVIFVDLISVHARDENEHDETHDRATGESTTIIWEVPKLLVDDGLIKEFIHQTTPSNNGPFVSRKFESFVFEPNEQRILTTPTALLNDVCLNGMASFLKFQYGGTFDSRYSADRCALFSTHDLVRIRYNASDENIWRNISPTEYWNKDIWIIPIHRPQQCHWVLCVAYLQRGEFILFDSFGDHRPWKKDIKDLTILVTRLVRLANEKNHHLPVCTEGWCARPALTEPVQGNDYDCGVWVLAWIAAVLRGYGTCGPSITEDILSRWRYFLGTYMQRFPNI